MTGWHAQLWIVCYYPLKHIYKVYKVLVINQVHSSLKQNSRELSTAVGVSGGWLTLTLGFSIMMALPRALRIFSFSESFCMTTMTLSLAAELINHFALH